MFTPGSKFFLGLTGFSVAVLVLYIALVDNAIGGSVVLAAIAVAVGLLAGLTLFNRDGDVAVGDNSAPANATPLTSGLWPLVATLGIGLMAVGLITHPIVFLLGLVTISASFVEWVIQGWSEGASSDASYNASLRGRLLHPLEFPVLAAVGLGVIILAFSRIMLTLSRDAGAIVFIVVSTLVLVVGTLFAVRPGLRKTLVVGVCALGAVGIVAGGIAAASGGMRDELVKAKEEDHFGHKECGEEKSKYFDKLAEVGVSSRSNTVAIVELKDGELSAREIGISEPKKVITIARANVVSLIFRNKTEGEHRLTANLGTKVIQEGVKEDLHNCTQMIGKDEEQHLILKIDKPSMAMEKPYTLTVPGIEDQSIEIYVP
jgi:hypothetical protein